MYIRGLIPWNFEELAEAVPIEKHPSQYTESGDHRTASDTPFRKYFTGGPILARVLMLTGEPQLTNTSRPPPAYQQLDNQMASRWRAIVAHFQVFTGTR